MEKIEIKLEKPQIGQSCNNCGICCKIVMCNTGAFLMKKVKYFGEKSVQGPCPAMMPEGDGYVCGLIKNPIKFIGKSKFRSEVIAKNVAVMIGAGNGCDDIGYNEDDFEENEKLSEMISKIRANPEYMANLQKSYEMIQKIRNGK